MARERRIFYYDGMALKRHSSCLLLLLGLLSPKSYARFLHLDSDTVDREELLSTEYYNDELGYRAPLSWERHWRGKRIGIMAGGGSYNKDRLMYLEKIKFASSEEAAATFSFHLDQKHDLLLKQEEREFRIRFNQLNPVFISAMLDSDSEKKWGDGGAALAFAPNQNQIFEIYAWSVDHYYNEKKDFSEDRYEKSTQTYGTNLSWDLGGELLFQYNFEYDTPLVWRRTSEGYHYEYQRRFHRGSLQWGNPEAGMSWTLRSTNETKFEQKNWLAGYDKRMQRSAGVYEAFGNWADQDAARDFTLGIMLIERKTDYTYQKDGALVKNKFTEHASPDILRQEFAHYVTYYHCPFMLQKHCLQYGLFNNLVFLTEDLESKHHFEIKPQLGWEYRFDASASVFVNTTYDLDDLYDNFPYKGQGRRFNPWGGGNLQFLAVF